MKKPRQSLICYSVVHPGFRIFTVFLLLAVYGCKIKVTTPEHGLVYTESGSYICESGLSCEIDVSTTDFSEEFIAEAPDDKEFLYWRKRFKGFCGGSSKPCSLSTANFSDYDSLLGVLQSNTVFYLEPVFRLKNQSAVACFNPERYATGSSMTLAYRLSPPTVGGDQLLIFENNIAEESTAPFGRVQAEHTDMCWERFDNGLKEYLNGQKECKSVDFKGVQYYDVNPSSKEVVHYGEAFGLGDLSDSISLFLPPPAQKFAMLPGDQYETDWEDRPPNGGRIHEINRITKYEGMETIYGVAGAFETCKFSQKLTEPGSLPTHIDQWYSVGSGVLVKEIRYSNYEDSPDNVRKLVYGNLNGKEL